MDTLQINGVLQDVPTFAGFFLSDLLPSHRLQGLVRYTVIVNTDAHEQHGSHWVAIQLNMRSSSG
jgi:hypothetical protein